MCEPALIHSSSCTTYQAIAVVVVAVVVVAGGSKQGDELLKWQFPPNKATLPLPVILAAVALRVNVGEVKTEKIIIISYQR